MTLLLMVNVGENSVIDLFIRYDDYDVNSVMSESDVSTETMLPKCAAIWRYS